MKARAKRALTRHCTHRRKSVAVKRSPAVHVHVHVSMCVCVWVREKSGHRGVRWADREDSKDHHSTWTPNLPLHKPEQAHHHASLPFMNLPFGPRYLKICSCSTPKVRYEA